MVYRFRQFEVDSDSGCLRRDGAEVPLRRKALLVLVTLIERRRRLVSKEELFAAVWPDTAVTDDVLAGVISELRKALGDNAKSPQFIKTVSRGGYRFVGELEQEAISQEPDIPRPSAASSRLPRVWRFALVPLLAAAGWVAVKATHHTVQEEAREVAWWRFDEAAGEQADDSSTGGHQGRLIGGVKHVSGKSGSGLSFDGVAARVEGRDDSRSFPENDTSRTLTAWIRSNSSNGDTTHFFLYGEAAPPAGFPQRTTLSSFNAAMRRDGTLATGFEIPGLELHGRTPINDGAWRHVAVVWRGPAAGGETRLYVDGREEAAARTAPVATVSRPHWWIGGKPGTTLFRGELDDVRLYNAALDGKQIEAIHRCSAGSADLEIAGRAYFFLPVGEGAVEVPSHGEIRNPSKDSAGVQLAAAGGDCSLGAMRGSDVGQNLRIGVDLLVPSDDAGNVSEAGPYFRSRRAGPGDGLIGGTSAGYWVVLFSNGSIAVQRLNPNAVVAFAAIPEFDAKVFHHLELAAVGEQLQVAVDGRQIRFDQAGRLTETVALPPVWDGPPRTGYNLGTAGIAFWARQNRGAIGGQVAKNLRVEPATTLLHP